MGVGRFCYLRSLSRLLALFACLASTQPKWTLAQSGEGDFVELRLWNIPLKSSDWPPHIVERRIFEAFCRRYPNIRVRALVPLKIEGPAQEGNEFLAVAGGVAPDVFYLFGRKVGDYNSQNFLLPLNEYLARYERENGRPYSGIGAPNQVWELCYDKGRILVVPAGYYSMGLSCDLAVFAKRGLAGRFPRDWDEMYEFARRITYDPLKEPDGKPGDAVIYGVSLLTGIYAGWHYLQYVWSAGGEVVQCYLPQSVLRDRGWPLPPEPGFQPPERHGTETLYKVPVPPVDYRTLHIRLSNEDRYLQELDRWQKALRERGLPTDYSISDLAWRLETDSPEAMEALKFYRKLAHQPWLRNGDHEFDITPEMFRTRRAVDPVTGESFDLDDPAVAKRIYWGVSPAADIQAGAVLWGNRLFGMQIGTLSAAENVDPKRVAFVPFPSRKGCPPAAFIAGHYLGINAAIAAEDRPGRRNAAAIRDAAWKYIEYVTGPEAERIRVETCVEQGLIEFIRPAVLANAGYEDLLARLPPERLALWSNLTEYARVEPYSQGFTHVMTRELGMAIEAALGDRPDPKTGEHRRNLQDVMSTICRNVNTMILGKMPEEVVRRRARIGWIIFAVFAAALVSGGWLVVRLAMRTQARFRDTEGFGVGGNPAARRLYAWLFLIPAVASIAIWSYYPLVRGLLMGFQDFRILGGSKYVGLRNFVEAVSEPKFWRYLLQTAQYMIMLVGIGFAVPIFLAILLTEIPRLKVFFRTVYYLPAVTTGLVTLFLWKQLLYEPTSQGVLNQLMLWFNTWPTWLVAAVKIETFLGAVFIGVGLLGQAGKDYHSRDGRLVYGIAGAVILLLTAGVLVHLWHVGGPANMVAAFFRPFQFKVQAFLRDPDLALFWVVIPVIWAGAGPGCLIYLAALKGIPEEQYEAADLDGAGVWNKFVHVTYPNLKALIIINFIGAVIAGFKESGNIFVMTGGGPEDATMTTGLYIWYNAFMFLNFGLATAMGWIMGALLIGFTLTQLRILNKLQFRNVAVEQAARGGGA